MGVHLFHLMSFSSTNHLHCKQCMITSCCASMDVNNGKQLSLCRNSLNYVFPLMSEPSIDTYTVSPVKLATAM